jgi:hypothetical protein
MGSVLFCRFVLFFPFGNSIVFLFLNNIMRRRKDDIEHTEILLLQFSVRTNDYSLNESHLASIDKTETDMLVCLGKL